MDIEELCLENKRLRIELEELKLKLAGNSCNSFSKQLDPAPPSSSSFFNSHGLSRSEIERFSRQLLVSDIGVKGDV